ncbi:protein D2 [Bombyx mori]|uniref:OV-16 antigen n=1 Tax=Bombyx mori TaxID=7091 RepID=A0A8R2AGK3_BOMMO|nr:protein D2 [Bombyx mori]
MGALIRCAIVLLTVATIVDFRVLTRAMSTVARSFEASQVVPDVIPKAPAALLQVKYPSGVEVEEGNELTPTQVKDEPSVKWDAEPGQYYTLAMVDPDVPSRKLPINRELQHWLVGNIQGNEVCSGETLSQYLGAAPPIATGLHRYVFLLYKQPSKLTFDEPRLPNISTVKRINFKIAEFAMKYNLGVPIAGNFFVAQFDVPILNNQLGV